MRGRSSRRLLSFLREQLVERPRVEHVGRGRPATPRGRDREQHVPEPAHRVRVGRAGDARRPPGSPRARARRCRSMRSGRPFVSIAVPVARQAAKTASRSTAFGGRWLRMRPCGWLIDVHRRVLDRRQSAPRQLLARLRAVRHARYACTQSSPARTSSGRSSEPSARMSHSLPRRTRNGASASFTAAISSAWRRSPSRVEARHDADVLRVVADRDVVVAERARRLAHLEHATPSRPTTSCARAGRRGSPRARPAAAARRRTAPRAAPAAGRHVRAPVNRRLVWRLGQLAECRDVRRRCRSPAPARSRSARPATATASIGTPSTVTPTARRSGSRSSTATISGSAAKRSSTSPGRAVATTTASRSDRSHQRRGSPAATPPSAAAIPPASARARFRISPWRGAARTSASARGDLRLGRRPDSRHGAQPPGRRSLPELVGRADAERAPEVDHPLRPEADEAAEPDQLRLHLVLQLVDLGQPAGLDELLQARLDRGADAAQLAHPAQPHELRDGRRGRAHELGRAPVGTHAVAVRTREIEQPRERLQPLGDHGVVGAWVTAVVSISDADRRRPVPRQ